ncbi:hypothetical protein GQ43DRAFT_478886 [Delitschia confertaspora ATCC 74209]|uniref:Uncharacterized protein n=1 Tax=Delitschia confertaspora ATCC 74209 TaxID=1513339 RepID=A0A9P4N1B7_9PLEO|nr:hypothetical protein GQ43DRAFT_478886 [Delitschia confertaspora ATCC 74209]
MTASWLYCFRGGWAPSANLRRVALGITLQIMQQWAGEAAEGKPDLPDDDKEDVRRKIICISGTTTQRISTPSFASRLRGTTSKLMILSPTITTLISALTMTQTQRKKPRRTINITLSGVHEIEIVLIIERERFTPLANPTLPDAQKLKSACAYPSFKTPEKPVEQPVAPATNQCRKSNI